MNLKLPSVVLETNTGLVEIILPDIKNTFSPLMEAAPQYFLVELTFYDCLSIINILKNL